MGKEIEVGEQGARGFATTHWSAVVQAGRSDSPEAAQALEALCRTYWSPLYHYVRQRGHGAEDAQDLTQSFFAQLLAKNYLRAANRERGKFRTFLLTALKHFLAHEWDKARTQKRGGRRTFVPLADEPFADDGLPNGTGEIPERGYDRNWAMTVFEQSLGHLREEHARAGRLQHFDCLKVFLSTEPTEGAYAQAAVALKSTPGAVAVAVHRLRQRYGQCVRDVVSETVTQAGQVEEELRYLISLIQP